MKKTISAVLLVSSQSLKMEKSNQLLEFDNHPAFARYLKKSKPRESKLAWWINPNTIKL